MYAFIRKTAVELGLANYKVIRMDVFRFIDQCPEKFDLIFAGAAVCVLEKGATSMTSPGWWPKSSC